MRRPVNWPIHHGLVKKFERNYWFPVEIRLTYSSVERYNFCEVKATLQSLLGRGMQQCEIRVKQHTRQAAGTREGALVPFCFTSTSMQTADRGKRDQRREFSALEFDWENRKS